MTVNNVLLIEDDQGDVLLVIEALAEAPGPRFLVHTAERMSEGLARLTEGGIDVVLLDLALPDASGTEAVEEIASYGVPLVVLTGLDDADTGLAAVRLGAQDYLVKGSLDPDRLGRTLRFAIERHAMGEDLREQSLVDDLTGISNRRGFSIVAEHRLKLARRLDRTLSLLFIDLDDMKAINDARGHAEGDDALRAVARLLRETFRESDVVGRLGGDEFCVLMQGDPGPAQVRLDERLELLNQGRPQPLSVSVGVVSWSKTEDRSLEELLEEADRRMYEAKG